MTLTKAALMAVAHEVIVEQIDGLGEVKMREPTTGDVSAWSEHVTAGKGKHSESRERLIGICLLDETGAGLMFPTADEAAAELGKLPLRIINPLFEMAQKASGLGKEAEEIEGN